MPLLDLEDFFIIIKYRDQGLELHRSKSTAVNISRQKTISHLLIQVVLFATVGYVSERVLREADYENCDGAKSIFFCSVKVS
jgi:hypothetical protein